MPKEVYYCADKSKKGSYEKTENHPLDFRIEVSVHPLYHGSTATQTTRTAATTYPTISVTSIQSITSPMA
jgi:hypothetical protein